MTALPDGNEGFSEEDRSYRGSRFSVVQEALFSNPYQKTWGAAGESPMPTYKVTFQSAILCDFTLRPAAKVLAAQSNEPLNSAADLRWGPDGKGFRRLLHPDGIS